MTIPSTYSRYVLPELKGFDSLTLETGIKTPKPEKGEVLIAVKAVSLNYRDLIAAKGQYPGAKPGIIPCSDGAGEVVAVGEGVTKWKAGDRVMGSFMQSLLAGHNDQKVHPRSALGGALDGMLTEYKILADSGLVRIPDHLSYEEASTLPCAGLTAWTALNGEFGNIPFQAGQTAVLQGTGGVSVFGAQFAIAQGGRAIITSSSDEKLQKVADHIKNSRNSGGAGELVTHNYKKEPEWSQKVKEITEEGADHILEVGGTGTVEQSFKAIRQGGVITDIGFIAKPGEAPPNISMLALWHGAVFRGILVGSRRQFERMCDAISISKIKPLISLVVDFKDAKKAYEAQDQQTIVGKVVIRIGN